MAFALLLIYVTILFVRPQEWWQPVAGFELVNITAILTLIATFITKQAGPESWLEIIRRNRFAMLMWGLFAAVVVSQLTQFRLRGAFDAFQQFGKLMVLFMLTVILTDHHIRVKRMVRLVILLSAIMCVHAFLQICTGAGFGGITPSGSLEAGNLRLRGSGTFDDPNDFAMIFLFAMPLTFSQFRQPGSILTKLFLLCWIPAATVVLYFTQSRGAVVGFCAMLLAYLWMAGRATIFRLLLTGILLATAVAFGPARARETVYESSAAGRIVEWGIANGFLKQNPLFGIGYGRWGDFESTVPHNSFVTCYAELGLVGYFFWFALVWLVLKKLLTVARAGRTIAPDVAKLASGLFAGTVGFFTAAFFLTRTYIPVLYYVLGLGIAFIRCAEQDERFASIPLRISKRDLRQSLVICLASIPAIWIVIRLYWAGGSSS